MTSTWLGMCPIMEVFAVSEFRRQWSGNQTFFCIIGNVIKLSRSSTGVRKPPKRNGVRPLDKLRNVWIVRLRSVCYTSNAALLFVYYVDYTVSQKKQNVNFLFCCSFYKYWPISITFDVQYTERICNTTIIDMSTSPTYCCYSTSGKINFHFGAILANLFRQNDVKLTSRLEDKIKRWTIFAVEYYCDVVLIQEMPLLWHWHQDSVPAHRARQSIELLQCETPKFFHPMVLALWLSVRSDLSSVEYRIQAMSGRNVRIRCQFKHGWPETVVDWHSKWLGIKYCQQ